MVNSNLYKLGPDSDHFKSNRQGDYVPDEQRVANNSQTYVVEADEFSYETIEQENGQATVVRFELDNSRFQAGDVVVVLSGGEIHFHGMIGRLAEGWATATDRRGSLLPATVQ
ncbi:MAG: hypothetical protein M3R67_09540 [Acidobacteriota bacterium]|nr:hypothetical protein [Acidobacteriota bacterium]